MNLQKLILFVLTAAPAHAKVQFYSSFATTGPAPTACTQASVIVTPLIASFHGPADWTWIITGVEAHTGQTNVEGKILGCPTSTVT